MALISINWRPEANELRKFGLAILIGAAVGAAVCELLVGSRTAALLTAGIGLGVGGIGLTGSVVALPLYWLWMGVAFVLGNITSRIILALIFFLVLTPISLLARIVRRDRLRLRSKHSTNWHEPEQEHDFERQF